MTDHSSQVVFKTVYWKTYKLVASNQKYLENVIHTVYRTDGRSRVAGVTVQGPTCVSALYKPHISNYT